MPDRDQVRETMQRVLGNVLRDAGRPVPPFHDDATLTDGLRLDSLDFAVTIVQLERDLGVDPFRTNPPRVRTFADLVEVYEQALANREI